MRKKLGKHTRAIISVVLVLAPAVVFGLLGKPIEMGVSILAGGVASLFVNLDRFERIKASPTGFEGDLKKVIEDAYATVESVKKIARTLLLSALYNLNHANRLVGRDDTDKHRMRDELDQLGRDLNLATDLDIRAAHETFYRLHTWDRFSSFYQSFADNRIIYNELAKLADRSSTNYPDEAAINRACRYLGEHPLREEQLVLKEDYLRYLRERNAVSKSRHEDGN